MDKVRLNIVYKDYGVISIPFPDIKSCDEFTVGYDNESELATGLDKLLNLGMSNKKVINIHLEYSYKTRVINPNGTWKTGKIKIKELPVKYRSDNFDFEDLRSVYTKFYQDDRDRIIEEDGIRNVKSPIMMNYVRGFTNTITDASIQNAVNSYLNSGYKVKRDAYFLLKQNGYPVKINKLSSVVNQIPNNLSFIDMKSDYFNFLKQYASHGEEEMAQVMDEIHSYDIEELREEIGTSSYDNFDTIRRESFKKTYDSDYDDILELQGLTGKTIEELKEMIRIDIEQPRSGRNRR